MRIGLIGATVATLVFGAYVTVTQDISSKELSLWMSLVLLVNFPVMWGASLVVSRSIR